jgi:CheY-like chemotaxis protein
MDGYEASQAIRKLEAEARGSSPDIQAEASSGEEEASSPQTPDKQLGIPIVALTADVMVRRTQALCPVCRCGCFSMKDLKDLITGSE